MSSHLINVTGIIVGDNDGVAFDANIAFQCPEKILGHMLRIPLGGRQPDACRRSLQPVHAFGVFVNVRVAIAAAVCTALLMTSSRAHAEDPAQRGRRLFAAGKYADAIAAFRDAAAAPDRVGYDHSCEIGLSYAALGNSARAHFYLSSCKFSEMWPRWEPRSTCAPQPGGRCCRLSLNIRPSRCPS